MMDKYQRQQKSIENYISAYNNFDVEGMLRDLHPEIRFKNISNGETNLSLKGIKAFQQQAEQALSLFSQRKQQIQHITFHQETVEVGIAYQGILASDLPNGMKAGDKIELIGKSIFRFQNDKIIEIQDIS
jgi:hypothetical protein